MEVEPLKPDYSPPSEQSVPPEPPAPEEEVPEDEVVQDEDLGENVDLMA